MSLVHRIGLRVWGLYIPEGIEDLCVEYLENEMEPGPM